MKRSRFILIVALLALSASFSAWSAEKIIKPQILSAGTKFAKGLFWKISKAGVPVGYIFGTIHSDDPRVATISAVVLEAIAKSGSFSLETLPDVQTPRILQEAMVLENDQKLEFVIGSDLYLKVAVQLIGSGTPDLLIPRIKPWGAMLSMFKPKIRKGLLLDELLLGAALKQHKPVAQVERLEELISSFDSIPLDTQIAILEKLIDHRDVLLSTRGEMVEAYLREDLGAMWKINLDLLRPKSKKRHDKIFVKHMVSNRNFVMAYNMENLLREGSGFFAVGALHLYGNTSVLKLLEDDGFQVSRIN